MNMRYRHHFYPHQLLRTYKTKEVARDRLACRRSLLPISAFLIPFLSTSLLHHTPAAVRKPQRPNSHDLCIVLCCKSHYESVHGLSSVPVRPITVPPDLRSSNVLLCGSLTYAHPRRIAIAHFRDLFLKIG
jgi:hypothetical protein